MTFDPNTSSVAEASISEKELFSEFVRFGYNHSDPFSSEVGATQYPLDNLMGQAGFTDVSDNLIYWIGSLTECEDPADEMESMVDLVSDFLQELKEVAGTFRRLQSRRSVECDDESDVWMDDEPRYELRPANWPNSDEGVGSNMTRELI
ncbi:hypothetical protein [Aquibium sp. ELW1220]|uniref:hypothetical protein n=1 Tax=Aquibium sp. ELW1220 TaxID=2976766 RepID=UPI0025B0E08D|nr:hypothetical protein [Aquibium sp. ELW1220]MDN2580874.1 hypothetical protein [Aquibium sp. ELW1220]